MAPPLALHLLPMPLKTGPSSSMKPSKFTILAEFTEKHKEKMRSKIRDSLQTGIRSGFLPARSDAVRRFRLAGCDALTGTLQAGIRSGFLFVRSDAVRRSPAGRVRCPHGHTTSGHTLRTPSARSDAVRRFRLTGCDALTGTLQAGIRFALLLLVVTPSGVFRLSGCDALTGTLQTGLRSGFLFVRSDAVRRSPDFTMLQCLHRGISESYCQK